MEITLNPRKGHSTTDISIRPVLTEVVMFGGCPQYLGVTKLADTTVLQFSEWCAPYSVLMREKRESMGKERLAEGNRDRRHEEEWKGRGQVM